MCAIISYIRRLDMRRRGGNPGFLFFFLFLIFFGTGGFFPLLLIVGIVLFSAIGAISGSKSADKGRDRRTYNRHYTRSSSSDQQKISRINAFLKKWFQANHSIQVGADLELVKAGSNFANLSSLEVYKDHSYLCSMSEFQNRFPDSYRIMIDSLYERANRELNQMGDNIVDVEATPTPEAPKPKAAEKEELSQAQKFINEINALNTNIPDDKISKDLYETCAYLKQINDLSKKLPNTKDKLNRLYEHYLPILIKILQQYESLQVATSDPAYEETKEKLSKTIQLINTAMKNIISSMTDQDFINLSADISTLEAVLKKDGLTNDDQLLARSQEK